MLLIACIDSSTAEAGRLLAAFGTEDDRCAAARHIRSKRRQQSLAARALLRSLLAKMPGQANATWRLGYDASGKPAARTEDGGPPVEIAIAHSADLIACAVTDIGPIGVDVERCVTGRPFEAIAAAAFGEGERRVVERGGAAAFYRIWTLREALAKASGAGLTLVVNRRDMFARSPCDGVWRDSMGHENWLFGHRQLDPGYALAVAVLCGRSTGPSSVTNAVDSAP